MKLQVPFYKQDSINECGPVALQMALEFLDKPYSKEELMRLVDSDKSGVTWTLGLAKAAAELGFKTEFYTNFLGVDITNYGLDFYKKNADNFSDAEKKMIELKKAAISLGVKIEERSLNLEEILQKINKDCIPLLIIDWGKINGKNKFIGHFAPIVGYDAKNVFIHNSGQENTGPYIAIEKSLFDSARKSKGTDEDIIFIYRKNLE